LEQQIKKSIHYTIMSGGYLTKINIYLYGKTFSTFGLANGFLKKSITGPMYIVGSCLHNITQKTDEMWFGFIKKEHNCSISDAIIGISELGAEISIISENEWTRDLPMQEYNNILVKDPVYDLVKDDRIVEIEIYRNINAFFMNTASMLLYILCCIILGFMLYRCGHSTIEKIKKYQRHRKYLKLSTYCGDEDINCTICLEDIKKREVVRKLICNHIFHRVCIDEWIKKKAICPNCNHDIFEETETTPLITF
jgi:hypothetical protein